MKYEKARYLSRLSAARREYEASGRRPGRVLQWFKKRRPLPWGVRWLSPICRVHHVTRNYGWVVAPWLPWTIGYFPSGGPVVYGPASIACNDWISDGWAGVVRRSDFHNCTWSGIY